VQTQNLGTAPLSQFSACTALNGRQYRVSLVHTVVAAANRPEIQQYFSAQSYQYVRWPWLLKRRASRPTAGHFFDAITIQISSFLFHYKCIHQFSFSVVPYLTVLTLQDVTLHTASNCIAARRGSHSGTVQIYVYRDSTPCRLMSSSRRFKRRSTFIFRRRTA